MTHSQHVLLYPLLSKLMRAATQKEQRQYTQHSTGLSLAVFLSFPFDLLRVQSTPPLLHYISHFPPPPPPRSSPVTPSLPFPSLFTFPKPPTLSPNQPIKQRPSQHKPRKPIHDPARPKLKPTPKVLGHSSHPAPQAVPRSFVVFVFFRG